MGTRPYRILSRNSSLWFQYTPVSLVWLRTSRCIHLFNTRGLAQLSLLKECSLTYYVAGTGLVAGQSKLILIILLEKELLVVSRLLGPLARPGVGTRNWKARLIRLSSLAASRWLPGSLASPLAPSPDAGLLRFGREAARRGAVPAAATATAAPHSVSPGGATYARDPALGHRRPASHRCEAGSREVRRKRRRKRRRRRRRAGAAPAQPEPGRSARKTYSPRPAPLSPPSPTPSAFT
nr:uncharacterized protein LOC129398087 [Pan paniscus]